jgi:hypothetical protein
LSYYYQHRCVAILYVRIATEQIGNLNDQKTLHITTYFLFTIHH